MKLSELIKKLERMAGDAAPGDPDVYVCMQSTRPLKGARWDIDFNVVLIADPNPKEP